MTTSVGIREFRAGLAEYISGQEPVAITRHGVTVGWFIPTPVNRDEQVNSLRAAAATLDDLLAANAVGVDEVMDDYKSARRDR